jgi:hypothetical protein
VCLFVLAATACSSGSSGGAGSGTADASDTGLSSGPDASTGGDGGSPDASSDAGGETGAKFTLALSDASVVSTFAQRSALGFRFGYVDGVMGAVNRGDAGYVFYASGHTVKADAGTCTGPSATPDTQGAYRIGISPDSITDNFGCQALIADSQNIVPDGGVTGPFDRDYVGGGPVLALSNASGGHALALFYHAEFHRGPTCTGAPCFYGTLGLAASVDGGATFKKLGEIVQPAVSRPDWVTGHAASSLSIGAGPYVLGDAQGNPVDPSGVNPATTYVYVFFDDLDTTNAAPCDTQQCLGVARASLQDVIDAAFGAPGAKASTALFSKYYTGGSGGPWASPAASGSNDDATAGGHYTSLVAHAFEASTLYDRSIGKFLLAYKSGAPSAIQIRTSSNVTSWPDSEIASVTLDADAGVRYPSLVGEQPNAEVGALQPYLFYTEGLTTWPQSTFMNCRVVITVTP